MSSITDLEEGFQELQKYSDEQFHLTNRLNEKIAKLESENQSLKTMLSQNLPSLGLSTVDLSIGISNQQLICETQLLLLKDHAISRELTLEESKKVQIFTDLLSKITAGKKPEDIYGVSKMSDEDLMKAAGINVGN